MAAICNGGLIIKKLLFLSILILLLNQSHADVQAASNTWYNPTSNDNPTDDEKDDARNAGYQYKDSDPKCHDFCRLIFPNCFLLQNQCFIGCNNQES